MEDFRRIAPQVVGVWPARESTPTIGANALSAWHDVRMEEAIPILHVTDATVAVAWYQRLGYEKESEHRIEPSLPAFVSIARNGTARLFLSEHTHDAGGELAAATTVYIRRNDLDAIAVQFGTEAIEQAWGAREICLTDPDGNRLRVGMPSE